MDNQIAFLRKEWSSLLFNPATEAYRTSSAWTDLQANLTFDWLMQCYQKSERKYHNLNHLVFLFKTVTPGFWSHRELLIRMWFFFGHDSIYQIDPLNPSIRNEHNSAVETRHRMEMAGFFDKDLINFVFDTIELSNHAGETDDPLQQFLLDCDLSILASEPLEYKEYVDLVRNEYGVVPQPVWVEKRAEFLEYMLDKKTIFQSPVFRTYSEEQARKNIQEELINIKSKL